MKFTDLIVLLPAVDNGFPHGLSSSSGGMALVCPLSLSLKPKLPEDLADLHHQQRHLQKVDLSQWTKKVARQQAINIKWYFVRL